MDIRDVDVNMKETKNIIIDGVKWFDLNNDYLRGQAFRNDFKRIDKEDFVSDGVNWLKNHPSGINISFKTNSKFIKIKAKLSGACYMSHMTAVGQIGFDLYYKVKNRFTFVCTTKINASEYELVMVDGLTKKDREFRLYFPLYQSLEEVSVGVEENSSFLFTKELQEKIVIYGTSISQGGCATRPGMAYSTIMDRDLNYEVINLGFSGNAHLEIEMAQIINRIDKKYLILEVEANNDQPPMLLERLPKFMEALDLKNVEKTFLITHFPYPIMLLKKQMKKQLDTNFDIQKEYKNVELIDGRKMLKELHYDETVDGVHLTDLGFYFVAKKLEKIIKKHE